MKRTYWRGVPVLIFVAACNAPQLPGDPPSGYEFESPPPPPPQTETAVADQLDPVLLEVFSLDPVELFDSFELQRTTLGEAPADEPAEGEPANCPQYDMQRLADEGVFAWDSGGSCDPTVSNARFQGGGESFSVFNVLEDDTDPASAFINRFLTVGSTARIFEDRNIGDGTGPRFDIAMGMNYTERVPTQGSADLNTETELNGTVFWNGTGSGAVWLSQRYSIDIQVDSVVQGTNKQVFIRGIVSGLQNPLIDAIIFNDFEMALATNIDPVDPTITTCLLEPAGSVELRDTNGYWYRISFQGSRDFDDAAGEGCDGVGDLIIINDPFNIQTSKPVTPTFTGLSDWGGRPWR